MHVTTYLSFHARPCSAPTKLLPCLWCATVTVCAVVVLQRSTPELVEDLGFKTLVRVVPSWHAFQQSSIGVKQEALQLTSSNPRSCPRAHTSRSTSGFGLPSASFPQRVAITPRQNESLLLGLEKLFPTEHNPKQSPTRRMCFELSGNIYCVSPMTRGVADLVGTLTSLCTPLEPHPARALLCSTRLLRGLVFPRRDWRNNAVGHA